MVYWKWIECYDLTELFRLHCKKVKEMLQREVQKAEVENRRNQSIITDYKQICSQLSQRLEQEQNETKQILQRLQSAVSGCHNCSKSAENISGLLDSKSSSSVIPESDISVSCHPSVQTNSQTEQRVRLEFEN